MLVDNFLSLVRCFDKVEQELVKQGNDVIEIRKIITAFRGVVVDIVIIDEAAQNKARDKDRALLHLAIGMLSTHTPFTAMHPEMVLVYLERAYKESCNDNGKS